MNIIDQEVKRRYGMDIKEQAYWIHEIEKARTEVETVSILIREIVRLETLIGNTSVILMLNVILTVGLLVCVLIMALGGGGVDSAMASKAFGVAKGMLK